jgi:hypothetical protein
MQWWHHTHKTCTKINMNDVASSVGMCQILLLQLLMLMQLA